MLFSRIGFFYATRCLLLSVTTWKHLTAESVPRILSCQLHGIQTSIRLHQSFTTNWTRPPNRSQPLDMSGSDGLVITDPQIALVWLRRYRSHSTYKYRWHVQHYCCNNSNCMIDVGGFFCALNMGVDNCNETENVLWSIQLRFPWKAVVGMNYWQFDMPCFSHLQQTGCLFSVTQLGRSDHGSFEFFFFFSESLHITYTYSLQLSVPFCLGYAVESNCAGKSMYDQGWSWRLLL